LLLVSFAMSRLSRRRGEDALNGLPPKGQKKLALRYTIWCNVRMDHLSDVLTAISHPTRRAIIGQLANGPARFSDVAERFDIALNAVTNR